MSFELPTKSSQDGWLTAASVRPNWTRAFLGFFTSSALLFPFRMIRPFSPNALLREWHLCRFVVFYEEFELQREVTLQILRSRLLPRFSFEKICFFLSSGRTQEQGGVFLRFLILLRFFFSPSAGDPVFHTRIGRIAITMMYSGINRLASLLLRM